MLDTMPCCPLCDADRWRQLAVFDRPQKGESTFGIRDYYRELWQCDNCGLFINHHGYDLASIYEGAYRTVAYEAEKISRFDAIMNLPFDQSDNKQRVERVLDYFGRRVQNSQNKLCDIGSGMGVFPAAMLKKGWAATVVDPDEDNFQHLKRWSGGGVDFINGFFPTVEIAEQFDLITFNKVLEHIAPIIETLSGALRFLLPDGLVYIELPDGETAASKSLTRQEFFLEHHYAFSMDAIALLARRAGMRVELSERIQDPSGKFTLYAFLRPTTSIAHLEY